MYIKLSDECLIHETQCNNKILEFYWLQDIYIYIHIYIHIYSLHSVYNLGHQNDKTKIAR